MLAKPAVGKERGWGHSSYGRHCPGLRDASVPLLSPAPSSGWNLGMNWSLSSRVSST